MGEKLPELRDGLRRGEDLDVAARREHPAVEIIAQSDRYCGLEMVIVHDLRGDLSTKTVYDIAHKVIPTQQFHLAGPAAQHGELPGKIGGYIEIRWALYCRFLHKFHGGDMIHTESGHMPAPVVVTDQIVGIVVPEESVG